VRAMSVPFLARLDRLGDHPLVGEARGVGLIGAIELVADKDARQNFDPALKIGAWVAARAMEYGLIVRPVVNDTIAFCPPLIITESQINDMFDAIEKALEDAVGHIAGL